MGLNTGQTVIEEDFINNAEKDPVPANNVDKAVKLESNGQFHPSFVPSLFGGDGSDGALTVSSGNTDIDLGGARFFVRNYSSISITGTGKVTFINPHANGTIIILRVKGNVTITSSTTAALDASGCGAAGGVPFGSGGGSTSAALWGTPTGGGPKDAGTGGTAPFTVGQLTNSFEAVLASRVVPLIPGAGGGGGDSPSNNGGVGGGALLIECGGAWNFTTANGISVAGKPGVNVSSGESSGGGGGGMFVALYNSLTSNSGTITVSGGAGVAGSASTGAGGGASAINNGTAGSGVNSGAGGTGLSYVGKNVWFNSSVS